MKATKDDFFFIHFQTLGPQFTNVWFYKEDILLKAQGLDVDTVI